MLPMLPNVPIFAGLDGSALDLVWQRANEAHVAAGTLIVREGEPGNRFYLIGEGTVRVCKHLGEPGETELARLGPNDFFGEMCILETLPRCASVQSLTNVRLCSITSLTFLHLYEVMPSQYS